MSIVDDNGLPGRARIRTADHTVGTWLDLYAADRGSDALGRDAIRTGFHVLPSMLTRGVLAFLASHEAREISSFQDRGKIMHEMRRGEMSVLQKILSEVYDGGSCNYLIFACPGWCLRGAHGLHGVRRRAVAVLLAQLWACIEDKADPQP